MIKRDLNRRAVIILLIGGVLSQAVYGGLRALTLDHDSPYAIAAWAANPAVDVVINYAVAAASVIGIGLLMLGRRIAWWWCVAILTVGAIDALHVAVAPYGGAAYTGVLALRAAVIYLFMTPLARTVYGVMS